MLLDVDAASTTKADSLLQRLLESDTDLDVAFDRFRQRSESDDTPVFHAVVPPEVLAAEGTTFADFLESVLAEVEEIEEALGSLRDLDERPARDTSEVPTLGEATAIVSIEELSNPVSLSRALEPLQTDAARFEFLLAQARHCLDRLSSYRLSQRPSEPLLKALQEKDNLWTIQYLVEFLRSLQRAADTFESLELPRPHIRDYLSHLYRMKDWEEMSRLVRFLERAVIASRSRIIEGPS